MLSCLHSPTLISIHDQWKNHQFSSVAQSCPTLCDPMNCSTPGLPVHHHLPEFTQTHIHPVRDAIQPSILGRPLLLLPPIPPSIRIFSNESTLRMRWPKGMKEENGWIASPTQWTWVWVDPGSWCWTGRPGVLWFMGLQSQTRLSD